MNKKCYIKPEMFPVEIPSNAILDTHVSGTDLPSTSTGGDTSDSTITPEAKGAVIWDDTDASWQ